MGKIIIIGAGVAGLGAAYHLHQNNFAATVYEKCNYIGGHAATFEKDGFIFDDGPHISFTKDKRIRKLFDESANNKVEVFKSSVNNYWKGHWIKHPAQANLYGLPKELTTKIIQEFFQANLVEEKNADNYEEWLYKTFGKTFAETFPMEYTKKFHTTTADKLDIDWIGPRLYQPDLNEVINGTFTKDANNVHYVTDFYYPTYGGFVKFLDQFIPHTDIKLSHKIINIDPTHKTITLSNGQKKEYDHLISSVPLPELVPIIEGVPAEVLNATKKLTCSSSVLVNLGINRSNISDAHWTYFYEPEYVFSRLSFPHMQSPNNTPENCGSIQAEIYFSEKYKPLENPIDSYIETTITDLKRCGILKDSDEIIYKESRFVPYANVIFDLDRRPNLSVVNNYLDKIDIKRCGRYGEWGYHWTDESFKSGEEAAKKIIA